MGKWLWIRARRAGVVNGEHALLNFYKMLHNAIAMRDCLRISYFQMRHTRIVESAEALTNHCLDSIHNKA